MSASPAGDAGSPVVDQRLVEEFLATRAGERVAISVLLEEQAGATARAFTLPRDLHVATTWVGEQAGPGRTIALGVATLSQEGAQRLNTASRRGLRARPRQGEHTGYSWVAADLDPGQDGQAPLRARVAAFPLAPTVLVDSGRGLHAWWHLSEPVDVTTGRQLCIDLARALQADSGTGDEGRALRLPGTLNPKTGAGRLAVVLEHHPSRRYPAEQLSTEALRLAPGPAAPVAPAPPTARPRRPLDLATGEDVVAALRAAYRLQEELDRIAGPAHAGAWCCPTGHDSTASVHLLRDDPSRWVCYGSGHTEDAGLGRRTRSGRFSGDVIDLLAWEAGTSTQAFLAVERARRHPPVPASGAGPSSAPPPAQAPSAQAPGVVASVTSQVWFPERRGAQEPGRPSGPLRPPLGASGLGKGAPLRGRLPGRLEV